MRKLSLLFVCLLSLVCLSGCKEDGTIESHSTAKDGLVVMCNHYLDNSKYISFIRDSYTGNIYMAYYEGHGYGGGGGMSPYYNAKGEIMKYEEFKTVHVH